MCQTSRSWAKASTATIVTTAPRIRSAASITCTRGSRSTATPPTSKNNSIGVKEQISTVPMMIADPVCSSTHQARATSYMKSPIREMVCPLQRSANERWVSDLNSTMAAAPDSLQWLLLLPLCRHAPVQRLGLEILPRRALLPAPAPPLEILCYYQRPHHDHDREGHPHDAQDRQPQ